MAPPTTRETMSTVPAGFVRIANGGTYDSSLNATRTVIASAVGALHGFPTVTLSHTTRGYVAAGAAMRWDEARWHVLYQVHDGGIHGNGFVEDNEAGARSYFAKLTDSQTVSAMRQRQAQAEDEARDEKAACAEVTDRIKIEAAKTYRSGWQWRAEWPGLNEWCGYAKTKAAALADGREAIMHRVYCHRQDQRAA